MLNDTDRFRCPANVAARVLDGEAIMIHLESGRYYSAEGDGGSRVGSIVAAVAGRFDVPPDRAREDVERFVAELLREELLVVGQAADVTGPADVVADFGDAPYSAPTLHAYRDMADLLALDPPMPSLKPMK
jgi:hypothetical protein